MVHLAPLSLAAISLLTLAAATPTATTTEPVFSFAKWVDDVVTNPGTALSPEEAWQAYLDTANSTTSVPVAARGGVEKRWDPEVSCNNYDPGPAWVSSSLPPFLSRQNPIRTIPYRNSIVPLPSDPES